MVYNEALCIEINLTGNQTCPDDVAPALIPAGMQPQDKP